MDKIIENIKPFVVNKEKSLNDFNNNEKEYLICKARHSPRIENGESIRPKSPYGEIDDDGQKARDFLKEIGEKE